MAGYPTDFFRDAAITFALNIGSFNNLRNVSGGLSLHATGMQELDQFDSLESVVQVRVGYNEELVTLAGFSRLSSLGADRIANNLMVINQQLFIYDNPSLVTVTGFTSLTTINGNLYIRENPNLQSVPGLRSLRRVLGRMQLHSNAANFNFSDLSGLQCHGGFGDTSTYRSRNCPNCPSWLLDKPRC